VQHTYIKTFKLSTLFIFNTFLFIILFSPTSYYSNNFTNIYVYLHIYVYIYIYIEEVLLRVKEQRNILHEISKRKANWIGHILHRNCLLQQTIEGKIKEGIEVTGRRGRKRTKLLDDLKERRGYSHLKEEALDRTMWRPRFGRGFGPVIRQIYIYITYEFSSHFVLRRLYGFSLIRNDARSDDDLNRRPKLVTIVNF